MINEVFANFVPHATEIDEINFEALPATIQRVIELSAAEGATVELVSMGNQHAMTADPKLIGQSEGKNWALTWRIFVQGTRVRKNFWADKEGNLNEKAF